MQKAVRFWAADFDFWGDTPTPEFCENSRERGPRSPGGTAEGFDPPLGAHRNAAARGGGCAGAGRARRKGGGVPRQAGRRRAFAGATRRGRYAGRSDGRFRRGRPGRSFRAAGRKRGAGGAWPREPHKGRVSGATARGGHVSGRRGAGGVRRLSGADAGNARAGAAVYGGRAGYSRGAAGGVPGRAKNALTCAACVGLRATGGKDGSGAGEKARFRYIRKRFSPGHGLCRFRADLSPKPCRFGRVAFSAARSDECVTPGGAGEKPCRKTKRDTAKACK